MGAPWTEPDLRPGGLDQAIADLTTKPDLAECILLDHTRPPARAQLEPLPAGLDPRVLRGLRKSGIEHMYRHQAEAWEVTRAGGHVVLATPTASGKSLCFRLPVLEDVARDPSTRALFIFPTKALGQDQVAALLALSEGADIPLKVHTFDGDTPSEVRTTVRREAQVVVTNPDMLHQGILPHHPGWMSFFRGLRYVVLDELHTYRGVFGSHVANVLRRLERICAFYGSRPQYIAGSATIANPGELAGALTGQAFHVIDQSGAPAGPRRLLVARPPVVNRALGIRKSYVLFARQLLRPFLRAQVPTIIFGLSRLNVEVLLKYLKDDLRALHLNPALAEGYRGGYLPKTRRRIEAGLRSGAVRFVVSTNALELGIDIGALQACFVVGYPGSIASLWQQAGRAGRREEGAAVVYVPRSNPLDQFVATEPDFLLGAPPEHARINPDNLVILAEHLKCAAFELPFDQGEAYGEQPPADTTELLEHFASHRILHRAGRRYHWADRSFPANGVGLRSIPGDNFVVIDQERDQLLAEVDFKGAHTTLYEGAIYNLQAVQYEVLRLDYEGHKAYVAEVRPDYFTDAMSFVEVTPLEVCAEAAPEGRIRVESGDVKVVEKVIGYKKIRFHTNENVGYGEVNLPELQFHTQAAWIVLPGPTLHAHATSAAREAAAEDLYLAPEDIALDVLSGLSHALHQLAALHLMCDPRDLGRCISDRTDRGPQLEAAGPKGSLSLRRRGGGKALDPFAFDPALFLYDTYPGGVGLSASLVPTLPALLARAGSLIARCPCPAGCPSCLGAFARPTRALKAAAVALVRGLAGT